jgi:hypothetical protein
MNPRCVATFGLPSRPRARALAAVLAIASLTTLSRCRARPVVSDLERPLQAQLAGCAEVTAGPVCGLGADRTVRLWLEAPAEAELEIRAGDETVRPTSSRRVEGGTLLAVRVPASASRIRLRARTGSQLGVLELRIADTLTPPWLSEAQALRGTYVYWLAGDNVKVGRVPQAGGADTVLYTLGSWNRATLGLAADSTHLFWVDSTDVGANGVLRRLPIGGGTATALVSNLEQVGGLIEYGSNLYLGELSYLKRITKF